MECPELRLLYVGRVVQRQKQVLDLVALAQALRALKIAFRIDVIGDGDDRQELQVLATSHAPEISCLGPMCRQEILSRYKHYDCFILCSTFEGMSIALMEAMAHGVVPVVTRVGGAPDLITDGVEGFMWPVGAFATAAERLQQLWRNRTCLRECSEAARRRIANAHDPVQCRTGLLDALRWAAARPRGSAAAAAEYLLSYEPSPYFPES
jgi:glycosyltransferase involved in cell wall biosynthesis